MRTALLAALIGSTALTLTAVAQTQPQATPNIPSAGEATPALAECDRLLAFLDERRPVAGVTVQQARRWKQQSQAEECRKALDRVTQASTPGDKTFPGYGTAPGLPGAPGDATKPADLATSGEPNATGALPSPGREVEISRLAAMSVYSARGEKLGEVDRVVSGPDGKAQVVIGHGGFLGLGERKVLIPLDRLALRDDRLVADRLSDSEIKALPDYENGDRFRELEGRQTAAVRLAR